MLESIKDKAVTQNALCSTDAKLYHKVSGLK